MIESKIPLEKEDYVKKFNPDIMEPIIIIMIMMQMMMRVVMMVMTDDNCH